MTEREFGGFSSAWPSALKEPGTSNEQTTRQEFDTAIDPDTPDTVRSLSTLLNAESGPTSTTDGSTQIVSSRSSDATAVDAFLAGTSATVTGGEAEAGAWAEELPARKPVGIAASASDGASCSASFSTAPMALTGTAAAGEEIPHVDVEFLVERLTTQSLPLTCQVVAYGWEQAALLARQRRALPAALTSALWPATRGCLTSLTAQSLLDVVRAWAALQGGGARHFRLAADCVDELVRVALPPAVKRMRDQQLAEVAGLFGELAGSGATRHDPGAPGWAPGGGASTRDLLRPAFAVVVAEVAWRCLAAPPVVFTPDTSASTGFAHAGPSPQAAAHPASPRSSNLRAVLRASGAWNWKRLRHEPAEAGVLKAATQRALGVLIRALAQLEPGVGAAEMADQTPRSEAREQ